MDILTEVLKPQTSKVAPKTLGKLKKALKKHNKEKGILSSLKLELKMMESSKLLEVMSAEGKKPTVAVINASLEIDSELSEFRRSILKSEIKCRETEADVEILRLQLRLEMQQPLI